MKNKALISWFRFVAISIVLFGIINLIGCSEQKYTERAIYILEETGTPFENAPYLSAPLTHGYMANNVGDSLHVLVISKHVGLDRMEVLPLGVFRLRNGSKVRDMILATPLNEDYQVIPTPTYEDFVIKNNAAKVLIDQYYSNYLGLGITRVEEWKNTEMANYKIDQFFKKNGK